MSHFSVLILGPEPELQLDPYAELDPHFDGPLAEDSRAEFLVDVPAASFVEKAREIIAGVLNNYPSLARTYRELLEERRPEAVLKRWFGGEIGPGGDWGHYANPAAKWDWFVLGGRWQGRLRLLPGRTGVSRERRWSKEDTPAIPGTCDQASSGDLNWPATRREFTPFAVLKNGEWHQRGQMDWFGAVIDPKANAAWAAEIDALLQELPAETLVSVYDCHV